MNKKMGSKVTKDLSVDNLLNDIKYAQDIIDTVREPFLVLDAKFRVVTANPAFYRTFKVTKEQTEKKLVYKLGNHQWDIPELRVLLENILPKKKVFNDFEVTHEFQTIGQKIMLLNARQIDHSQLILLAIEDITKGKQLDKLRASYDKRFQALIEKSLDAVALVTIKGKVTYASPSTENVIGYTVEEFQKLSNPFKLAPPDDRKYVTKIFEKLIKKPGSNECAIYRVTHKKGHQIWIESVMTNLLSDPDVGAIVINYRDVSKRKELETQKNDFIGIASHELKTPVTSIKAYTQLLQRQFKLYGDKKASENLANMDTQLNKLSSLINDLLDVTKIETGKMAFNYTLFDFDTLVANTVGQVQIISENHKIIINSKIDKHIFADRERIGLVLTNLLTNAVKYSPDAKKVNVHISEKDNNVVMSVQDFGIGIPRGELGKVFERFFRVKGSTGDTYPGLGLGLYISAEIIKRHSGKMWLKSKFNKGSTFYFTIPIKLKPDRGGIKMNKNE